MPTPLIVLSIVGIAVIAFAIRCVIGARQANPAKRILAIMIFIPIALMCLWGFAAAMEPGDYHLVWRFLYGIVLLTCLFAIGWLALAKRRTDDNSMNNPNR